MKFLIVKLSSLGDIIHSLPIVDKLRNNFPSAQIDWLAGKKGFEFLSLIKEINNLYLLNFKNLILIQKQKYDYVIDVQGLFKSAFLARFAFGKHIIGFKHSREFADIFYDEKISIGNLFKTNENIVDLNLRLIKNITKASNANVDFLIPKNLRSEIISFSSKKPRIAVFPATTWESKLWPMEYWFELIKDIQKDFEIVLSASKNDMKYINNLISMLNKSGIGYTNLIGKTTIKDLIYLIQNVDLVIGLDSAPLHLASAIKNDYGRPDVIGIYGPTILARNGPYEQIHNCLYLLDLECIACRKKICPLGHHKCMRDILPKDVKDKISLLMNLKIC